MATQIYEEDLTLSARRLGEPLALPGSITLANRIAKAAMSEHLATRHGAPTSQLIEAYRAWATSGAGLLVTGNVSVDGSALEAPRNVVIEDDRHLEALTNWARAAEGTAAKIIVQLSHPGRQSMRGMSIAGRAHDVVAPSAVRLGTGGPLFKRPRALADNDIEQLIARFATAASIVSEAGFAGVQIHAAHGYLLSQFLSPLTNHRTDRWGGSLDNRMRMLLDITRAVRDQTPAGFLVSIKLNSADFQRGGFDNGDALRVATALQAEGISLLEISGGTYESAAMLDGQSKRESTRLREAYFLEFAEQLSREVSTPLMLTGGFRTVAGMAAAVDGGAVDLVGLGRPLAHDPYIVERLLAGTLSAVETERHVIGNKMLDDFLDGSWHQQQIALLGAGRPTAPRLSARSALVRGAIANIRDVVAMSLPR